MKRYAFIIAVVFISTSVYAVDMPGGLFKQEKKPAQQKESKKDAATEKIEAAAPQAGPQKKLTREEMISRINEMLKNHPNIVSAIQGLEANQAGDVAGYTYNGKKIEELDEDALIRLLAMINQQVSIENLQKFERQQRQLKNLQQIEQINRTQRALREQQALTKSAAPKIYTPPKIPKTRY